MVVIVLLIGRSSVSTHRHFQVHFFKIMDSGTYHTFKTDRIAYLRSCLLRQVFSGGNESDAVPFRVSICHRLDLLLGHGI